jgi:hypothetical protein
MRNPPHRADTKTSGSPSTRHYNELIEQSRRARRRGDHWAAQQLASEAHRFAMDEQHRLQRLALAEQVLAEATRQLKVALDKHADCDTVAELQERYPDVKRVVTAWENAKQRVDELSEPEIEDSPLLKQSRAAW